jgi:hypothetical protein
MTWADGPVGAVGARSAKRRAALVGYAKTIGSNAKSAFEVLLD